MKVGEVNIKTVGEVNIIMVGEVISFDKFVSSCVYFYDK